MSFSFGISVISVRHLENNGTKPSSLNDGRKKKVALEETMNMLWKKTKKSTWRGKTKHNLWVFRPAFPSFLSGIWRTTAPRHRLRTVVGKKKERMRERMIMRKGGESEIERTVEGKKKRMRERIGMRNSG